jgi:D-methionine transport system substrate-binding protein
MAMAEKLVIGATPTPHAEILELIKDDLAAKGIELEIVVYTEYTTPNMALSAGDLDANYFQHIPYMDAYNASVADDQKLAAAIGGRRMNAPADIMSAIHGTRLAANLAGGMREER